MLQVVRRQSSHFSARKATPIATATKNRRFEKAFLVLVAVNLFLLSSAASFYWLAHKY